MEILGEKMTELEVSAAGGGKGREGGSGQNLLLSQSDISLTALS